MLRTRRRKQNKNRRRIIKNYRRPEYIFKKIKQKLFMNEQQKKDLINYLLVKRLKKISEPIKIQTRIIRKDREKKRIALIDLYAVKNNKKNFKNIYNY